MAQQSYPAHGWLPQGAHFDWQHPDQGRDFVTDWRGVIQAPGDGVVLAVSSDRPFPNGFGPAFPIVEVTTGPFAGHIWYVGHCTSLVKAGQRFSFGTPLARADQGHNFSGTVGGWVELGNASRVPGGWSMGPNSPSGHWFDALLKQPLTKGGVVQAIAMVDTLGSTLGRIPRGFWSQHRIAGYTTGSGGIEWTDAELAEFPHAVRIDQAAGVSMARGALVADVESGAKTIADAVKIALSRHKAGVPFTVYIQESRLAECRAAMKTAGVPAGYVTYWLANWNYSEAQATARLGGDVVAVQWASPTSNPHTLLPGSSVTLVQANADLSVTAAGWLAAPKSAPEHPAGVASFAGHFDLHTGLWAVDGTAGNVTWGPNERWASAEVQLCIGGARKGQWRSKPLPWNAEPLGAN